MDLDPIHPSLALLSGVDTVALDEGFEDDLGHPSKLAGDRNKLYPPSVSLIPIPLGF